MGKITISKRTHVDPLVLIGELSGVCYNSDTEDKLKNYKRGLNNLASGHMRVAELPDVYMIIEGYSAKVVRELYTHIGGAPTRLQESTRYVDYANEGFNYVTPKIVTKDKDIEDYWDAMMEDISMRMKFLENEYGVPHEDASNALPLAYQTKMIYKINLRTLIEMSHQRMCMCAYWEFRQLFNDIIDALSAYSHQWEEVIDLYFMPKCKVCGYCTEGKRSCGLRPLKKDFDAYMKDHLKDIYNYSDKNP